MLLELHVRDFVLIESATLELGAGLTVVSGATGDGKTLLLRALRFLLGERASPDRTVRQGASLAVVEALFRVDDPSTRADLRARGAPEEWDEPELVLSRSLDVAGKSRIKIGGRLATASELRAVGARLVDVLSQHEYQSLSRRDRQRELLDRLGGAVERTRAFGALRETLRDKARQRDELAARSAEGAARDAERRALVEALRALAPRPGELEELERERDLLVHLDEVRLSLEGAHDRLVEREDAALDVVKRTIRDLGAHAERSRDLAALVETLEGVASELAAAGNALVRERDRLDADPARLARIEQRIDAHRDLARRIRDRRIDPHELAQLFDELEVEGRETRDPDVRIRELDGTLDAGVRELEALGAAISRERTRAARALERAVGQTLVELAMPDARLSVQMRSLRSLRIEGSDGAAGVAPAGRAAQLAERFPSAAGLDEVELQFAATPGQPLAPLQAVASGGELARVCLALKRALADVDDTPLLVFDEVDQNVGGRLGAAIGRTLRGIASRRQVIAVTHLPSVAAFATLHFAVAKSTGASARTTVRVLAAVDERERELALMIRGEPVSETALEQARELIRLAQTPAADAGERRRGGPEGSARRARRAGRGRRASRAAR